MIGVERPDVLKPVDYLAIGHVTHDLLPDRSVAVGGTAAYAALTAAALGRVTGVLTSVGKDFPLRALGDGIVVVSQVSDVTTTFENIYIDGHRRQVVYRIARPLHVGLLPEAWRASPIVHIGPVIEECAPELVAAFDPTTFIGITPQGWMRTRNGEGHVHPRRWQPPQELLERASAVVFSEDDVGGDWDVVRTYAEALRLLVVTAGPRGGVLYWEGTPYPFPALGVPEVDPTGAGDIFAAVFFSTLASGQTPLRAARFAACVASRSVTRRGLDGVPRASDLSFCETMVQAMS